MDLVEWDLFLLVKLFQFSTKYGLGLSSGLASHWLGLFSRCLLFHCRLNSCCVSLIQWWWRWVWLRSWFWLCCLSGFSCLCWCCGWNSWPSGRCLLWLIFAVLSSMTFDASLKIVFPPFTLFAWMVEPLISVMMHTLYIWSEGCLSFPLFLSLDYYCISNSEFVLLGLVSFVMVVLSLHLGFWLHCLVVTAL